MRTKVFLKRVLVTCLIASMVLPGASLADTDETQDTNVIEEAAEQDSEQTEGNTAEDTNTSEMSIDDYKYILDYYNIDKDNMKFSEYKKLYGDNKIAEGDGVYVSAYEAYKKANHYEGMEPEVIKTDSLPREYYGDNNPYGNFNEFEYSLKLDESGFVDFEFEIKKSGFYTLSLDFYNVKSKNSSIRRAIFVDGKLPYNELANIELKRMWINNPKAYEKDDKGFPVLDKNGNINWNSDNTGNDLKVSQLEVHDWQRSSVYDSQGYYPGVLSLYLEEGKHIITLYSITEAMVLYGINFEYVNEVPSYKDYLKQHDSLADNAKDTVIINAENASVKSSQMLYPQQDQSSAVVSPYSARYLLNNVIGGNSWRLIGDWLEWDFDVSEDGYYNIELLCKQNFTKGVYVSRKITIDGEVPFEEFNQYGFEYESTWFYETLGTKEGKNKEPYKIYLKKGSHKIRMQVVLGEFGDIVGRVSDVTDDLNKIYREVICVTGVAPDAWRDYQVESTLPNLTAELQDAYDKLDSIIKDFEALVGEGSEKERALTTMRTQVKQLIKDNEYFVKVVADYRSNVRACGTWITEVIDQPLAIDQIVIVPAGEKTKHKSNNFWIKLIHELKRLFYSFIVDYDIVGDVSDPNEKIPELVLWIGTGRDQSSVIKSMISEQFTSTYGINVTVMLVDIGTLLQATLAGQGPDIALEVNYDLPVNYGLRGAVYDLANFSDLDEVLTRFDKSSYEAYQYGNSTYALPCTQTFLVMFYRKDILKELELDVPETWDDMITALTVMSQNKMDLGMLPGEEVFLMYLLQNGAEYYNEDGSKTILDTEEAINAFTKYCEIYTDYGVDKTTNVEQRFRTGEAPLIITNFGYYNNLQVSAPDINGLWGVTQVPGTVRYNSSGDKIIDNTIASVGNACVIMSACKDKESAWKFLKWWTETDTQVQYSHEMESINGASAKVPTANKEAFKQIGYPVDFTNTINTQRENIRGIRQVAGSYFTYRYINNAFYAVTADKDSSTPREELTDRITYINDEIAYKRHELRLD